MRRRLFASALAITALSIGAVLAAPRGASAGTSFEASNQGIANVRVSSPVADAGNIGFHDVENCTTGSYETNRSESHLAVNPSDPSQMAGSSKFFFSANDPYSFSATNGRYVDWSGEYQFYVGYYDIRNGAPQGNALVPGYTCDHVFRVNGKDVTYQVVTDPVSAFDTKGNLYFFQLAFNYTNGQNGVYVSKRSANGTWGAPVEVDAFQASGGGLGHELDKQWIAVDISGGPFTDRIYAIWVDFSWFNGRIKVSHSSDGGATWTKPVTLSDAGGGGAHGQIPQIGVDGRGIVYAVWNGDFQGAFKGQGAFLVSVSEDGGDTWSKPYEPFGFNWAGCCGVPGTFNGRIIQNTTFRDGLPYFFAADPHGSHVYVAEARWSANASAGEAGFYNTYLDRLTFDPATKTLVKDLESKANDNTTATDSFQGAVAADHGTVVVSWYDRRLPCGTNRKYFTRPGATNYCINTAVQFYDQDGARRLGTNTRASAVTWDAQQPGDWLDKGVGDLPHSQFGSCFSPGVQGQICVTFIGDYFGLALANGNAYVLNVSTAPQFNTTRTLAPEDRAWWNSTAAFWESQDEATGGITNFYQQQVLQIVPVPSGP